MDSSSKFDLSRIAQADSFSAYNNIRVTKVGADGVAEGVLTVTEHSLNPHGIVHGGCLASLADTVAGWAVARATGSACVTVNYGMNFLRPAKGSYKTITCRAEPEKLGRTLCVYRVTLSGDDGKEVATGNFTFFLTGGLLQEQEK